MSLLAELRRRKVFKVAAVYAVVSWLSIQVAATIAPLMSLPETAPRLVLFLLIILFPVALFLGWAYELKPDSGHVGTGASSESAAARPGKRLLAISAIALMLIGGIGLYIYNRPAMPGAASEPTARVASDEPLDKSIAVLPFKAFSSDADDQFFADGLSDTLLNKLAQLSDVKVISRSSSFQYRGDAVDVRQVGEDLQVATVLEGSVQRSGDRLRIIAQLIDTRSGGHLWSNTFDRSGADIFAIHDEIADAVVDNLELSLSPEERERLQANGTDSVEAYNLLTYISERAQASAAFEMSEAEYERDQYFWIDEVRRVLEIDPSYAEAYRFIADTYSGLVFQSATGRNDAYHIRKGFEALDRAMLLEPDNPENLVWFASLTRRDGKSATAEAFARMAYAQLPNDAGAVAALALTLIEQGKNGAEALALVEREAALDPTSGTLYRRHANALRQLGRPQEALALIRSVLPTSRSLQLAAIDLASVLSVDLGRHVDAFAALIDARRQAGGPVGETLLRGWLDMSAALGLGEELRKHARPGNTLAAADAQSQSPEQLRELNRRLRASTAASAETDEMIAAQCLLLEDFECVVEHTLRARPGLDYRDARQPSLIYASDFAASMPLSHSLRKLGEAQAAERLIEAARQWYAARTSERGVFARAYRLPELLLLQGDTQRAMEQIRERVMLDDDGVILQCVYCSFDSSLYETVRDDPRFRTLVAEYERRRTAAATAVRTMIADAGF